MDEQLEPVDLIHDDRISIEDGYRPRRQRRHEPRQTILDALLDLDRSTHIREIDGAAH